ncbi:MAG: GWxTD domain-containing protein [Thermoanaerobaculales bacterium]
MRRFALPLVVIASLAASFAAAELSQTFKDWPNGPAGFLLTASEKKAYAELKTDAEAQAFVDLFFAKRDKNLGAVNEFKLDFDARVVAADKMFSAEKLKGSLSDRGKVLIILGKPLKRNLLAGPPGGEEDKDEMFQHGKREEWLFTADGNPPAKKSDEIWFVFQETRPNAGDFPLERSDTRTIKAAKFLADRVEKLVIHPKLTEAPRPGLLPGSKAATTEQLAVLDNGAKWPQGAGSLVVSGVQSDVLHPIWVYLQLPDEVAAATQAIGRIRTGDGSKTVGSFGGVTVTPLSVPGARAYEFSLPVQEAGEWKVDLALLNESGPVVVTTLAAKNEATPSEGPYIAPIYWGADVRQEAQAHLGDAFNLGGWHVIPRLDHHYASEEGLTYFVTVTRPNLDEQGNPKVELKMVLYVNGKKADETSAPLSMSHVPNTDIWLVGSKVPMAGFGRGKEFEIELTVQDTLAKVSRSVRIPFVIPKAQTPAAAASPAPAASPVPKQ